MTDSTRHPDDPHHPDRATLSLYHDGEGPVEMRSGVEQHLADCDACRADLARLESLSEALRELPELKAPGAILTGVQEGIQAGYPAAPPTAPPPSRWFGSLAAAALVMISFAGAWIALQIIDEGREVAHETGSESGIPAPGSAEPADRDGAFDFAAPGSEARLRKGVVPDRPTDTIDWEHVKPEGTLTEVPPPSEGPGEAKIQTLRIDPHLRAEELKLEATRETVNPHLERVQRRSKNGPEREFDGGDLSGRLRSRGRAGGRGTPARPQTLGGVEPESDEEESSATDLDADASKDDAAKGAEKAYRFLPNQSDDPLTGIDLVLLVKAPEDLAVGKRQLQLILDRTAALDAAKGNTENRSVAATRDVKEQPVSGEGEPIDSFVGGGARIRPLSQTERTLEVPAYELTLPPTALVGLQQRTATWQVGVFGAIEVDANDNPRLRYRSVRLRQAKSKKAGDAPEKSAKPDPGATIRVRILLIPARIWETLPK